MIGQSFSHYEIIDKLGEGGMGVVYKARDTRLDRVVALKFLPQAVEDGDDEKARFLQEARAAATLNHPNVCGIFRIDEFEGRQFIEMEYVDGETLRDKVPTKEIEEAVGYILQVTDALREAHAGGIVHRDIKCDNIMVNARGQVKIMDFGLAKLKGALKLTQTHSTVGTLAYMSPEQIRGEEVDARSDLFSLGVVFFELLAGRLPFRGEHEAAILYSIVNEEPASLLQLRPGVPIPFVRVIERLLKKDAGERYQSAAELLSDLQRPPSSATMRAMAAVAPTEYSSIAVLPFDDMSPAHDQDYLCEGLAEEIMSALMKLKNLRISARSSAFAFKGKQVDVREVGRKLNVQAVLEGSVRKSGHRLRIAVQLISVGDGYQLWADRYDRELKDVFEIQDEITENVVGSLKIVLTEKDKASIGATPAVNVEAYEYYLRGKMLIHKHDNRYEESVAMFRKAIAIDTRYAPAWCGLATALTWRFIFWDQTEEVAAEAESASRRAVELAPDLSDAYAALGLTFTLRKKYEEAEIALEKAIQLDPQSFDAHYNYARNCLTMGKREKATALFRRAIELRPEDFQVPVLLATLYKAAGRKDLALESDRQGALKARRHLDLNPTDVRALYLGAGALYHTGEREAGLAWIRRALELDPRGIGTLYNAACFYSATGHADEAFDCLDRALAAGFDTLDWVKHDPDLDPIRSDPRFALLLTKFKTQ